MNSWTNPETLTSLIGALTALIVAIGVAYHSVVTRNIAKSANITANTARVQATQAVDRAYSSIIVGKNNTDKNN